MRTRTAIAVLLVVALLACAGSLWVRHWRAMTSRVEARPVCCEACGTEYVPRRDDPEERCPNCGSTARVIQLWYRCRDCGHEWVGCEQEPDDGHFRKPGGEWVSATEFDPTMICPECGSTRASSILHPGAGAD